MKFKVIKLQDNYRADFSPLLEKYFGKYIKNSLLQVAKDGSADFDFGSEELYYEGANSYGFLASWYLYYKLSNYWIDGELKKPIQSMHPLARWHQIELERMESRRSGIDAPASGAEVCWRFLGYHLSLIAQNSEVTKKMLRDLRNPKKFQGTRFEVTVAAGLIAAGFDLKYEPEKGPGTHPEFIATDPDTGIKFAVEAKSCHKSGLLGFPIKEDQSLVVAARRQIHAGLLKITKKPLLVFVELNLSNDFPDEGSDIFRELEEAQNVDEEKKKENGYSCLGGFFINDSNPYYLVEDFERGRQYGWAKAFSFENKHDLSIYDISSKVIAGFRKAARIPDIDWENRSKLTLMSID